MLLSFSHRANTKIVVIKTKRRLVERIKIFIRFAGLICVSNVLIIENITKFSEKISFDNIYGHLKVYIEPSPRPKMQGRWFFCYDVQN